MIRIVLIVLLCSCVESKREHSPLTSEIAEEIILPPEDTSHVTPVKVAIFGDSGRGDTFRSTLNLIRAQGAEMVIHLGDLAYDEGNPDSPQQWVNDINAVLGLKFPYFFLIGNHDVRYWFTSNGYNQIFIDRLAQLRPNICQVENGNKDHGIQSSCSYKEVFFALSGIGSYGEDSSHEAYLEKTLSDNADQPWKICAWHKNRTDMQVGKKSDDVTWKAYQICQKWGAMITTGHEHSYSRTRTLTKIGDQELHHGVEGESDHVSLAPGKTFVVVSGIGGHSLRPYSCKDHDQDDWWASIFSANYQMKNGVILRAKECSQNRELHGMSGVLFVTFNFEGNPRLAKGVYLMTDGTVGDEFTLSR